jgi:hypothetical protein
MSGYPKRLSPEQWRSVAATFGCGTTVPQLQQRWFHYAKAGRDASRLSLAERRQAAALAIDHPGEWKWIASQLGNGHCRSAHMVERFGVSFLEKLKKLGMTVERGRDIEFVPDSVFEEHYLPTGFDLMELVTVFYAKRTLLGNLPPPPDSLQPFPVLASFNVSRPPPPSASIVSGSAAPEVVGCFRECDDERLRAIVSAKPQQLVRGNWQAIADEFGCGVTARQLQDRWNRSAKPGFDGSKFTLSERRQVAALAIDHPGEWKWIASQIGNGSSRSRGMVQSIGARLLKKLREIGLEIESGRDIEFVPDAVFGPGRRTRFEREEMVAEFTAAKALHTAAAAGAGSER